jgi:catechol 2,3-dioxygenase-like lactoylglutathione lyase family enzyme
VSEERFEPETAAGGEKPSPAGFDGVLETSIYHSVSETAAVERFYVELLGLPVVSRWPGGIALRVGAGVLLLFERETVAERSGPIAEHGSNGPGHLCLLTDRDGYEAWRDSVAAAAIELTHEQDWPGGHRSFYFKDPAGNLLEIADGDLWPRE